MKVKLAEDTISKAELKQLSEWVIETNQLTKGPLTSQFEEEFSKYFGVKHSVFVNSGSSANLLMAYSLQESGYLKNKKVIVPAVSWITTLSPFLQLGYEVILCDSDKQNLGLDLDHFEQLCKEHNPALAILVHILGHPNSMNSLQDVCKKYDVLLIEDACEALGTKYEDKFTGNLSLAGSFSFYFGHHISTIEGGIVTTNDTNLYNIMLSIRSHGWARDLQSEYQENWQKEFKIDEFRNLYTFYYAGYNLRSTDLNAFLGLLQIKKLDNIIKVRQDNFNFYKQLLSEKYWCQSSENSLLSSFAYGTFVKNRLEVSRYLKANEIECRPLVCGSMGRQPFWIKKFGETRLPVADIVHDYGLYLPNHLGIDKNKIMYIADKFNQIAIPLTFELTTKERERVEKITAA